MVHLARGLVALIVGLVGCSIDLASPPTPADATRDLAGGGDAAVDGAVPSDGPLDGSIDGPLDGSIDGHVADQSSDGPSGDLPTTITINEEAPYGGGTSQPCPSGQRAIGGGGHCSGGELAISRPLLSVKSPIGWEADCSAGGSMIMSALCVSGPIADALVVEQDGPAANASAPCPQQHQLASGGCECLDGSGIVSAIPLSNLQRYECTCSSGAARAYAVCLPDDLANSIDLQRNDSTSGSMNNIKTPCDPISHVVVGGGCAPSEEAAASGILPYPGLKHWYCNYTVGLPQISGWSICARPES